MRCCHHLLGVLVTLLQLLSCTYSRSVNKSISIPIDGTKLSPPEPCDGDLDFCGEDESKYPAQEFLDRLIMSNGKVQQWIEETSDSVTLTDEEEGEISSEPSFTACTSRREKFPSFGRSRNIGKKWKYIIEISQVTNKTSNADILICNHPGKPCLNDKDSPDGEGSTICRQVYRNQRLLAMDENGEASVDSFKLPSGCICHHVQNATDALKQSQPGISPFSIRSNFPKEDLKKCTDDTEVYFSHSRVRRDRDRIVFPDEPEAGNFGSPFETTTMEQEDLAPRSNEVLVSEEINEESVTPCPNNAELCEDLPNNLIEFIELTVNTSKAFFDLELNVYHPTVCKEDEFDILSRGFPYGKREVPLCVSSTAILHPQKGRNIHGQWRHIVNTELYKQGVSVEKCDTSFEGGSCHYNGADGIFPEATTCKQQYSRHPFVVISPSGAKSVELFNIPTACVCHIDQSFF